LRYRAARARAGHTNFTARQLAEMDRNGRLAAMAAPFANWASAQDNKLTRPILENLGVDPDSDLPKFVSRTFVSEAKSHGPKAEAAPAAARKVALFPTCFVNYNNPKVGMAALGVLAKNGITPRVVYPGCCGMPFLEQAELDRVSKQAEKVSRAF